jgi:hypothetical protein
MVNDDLNPDAQRNGGPRHAETALIPRATLSPMRRGTIGGRDGAAGNGSTQAYTGDTHAWHASGVQNSPRTPTFRAIGESNTVGVWQRDFESQLGNFSSTTGTDRRRPATS